MIPNYHVYDDFRQSWSINGDFDWLVVHHLSQSIDNDKDRVIAVALLVCGQR